VSILGKLIVYTLKEAVRPALEKFGEQIGITAGAMLSRKMDPADSAKVAEPVAETPTEEEKSG
jgi:hypothetical protein